MKEITTTHPFTQEIDTILRTVGLLFATEGKSIEVAVITNSTPAVETNYVYPSHTACMLYLSIDVTLYNQISDRIDFIQNNIYEKITKLRIANSEEFIDQVFITPKLEENINWRDEANTWLSGKNVSNQGRVRSDNVAPKECDGLLFRSDQEINLYKVLKSLGVAFAPLPVFLHGGKDYKRIEPDFVILKDGIFMVVEVDGDTVHKETPAEAHNRLSMLCLEGAHIERVKASECDTLELAIQCAEKIMDVFSKLKRIH